MFFLSNVVDDDTNSRALRAKHDLQISYSFAGVIDLLQNISNELCRRCGGSHVGSRPVVVQFGMSSTSGMDKLMALFVFI